MSTKNDFGLVALQLSPPTKPPPGNQSSSLPSTPYHHARRMSLNTRSPSPEKLARTRSPTTHSESETGLRLRGKGPLSAGCKYETGMAHSRRRIPYSVGGDKLEKAGAMPKKFLSQHDEEKLSGDMRELYGRLYPSTESDRRRSDFLKKLARILNEQWPGNEIEVHVFGSSGNLLCTDESDGGEALGNILDICITTPLKALERVCLLAKALAEHGMERVVCVPHAKVPIVKFWDPDLRLACDMNVNNTLALENTRMIKTYVEIDPRVRPLAMIIKHWTRQRILNDAALGGTLSSYTWICMILNFLQTRNPPVLPCLHRRPHQRLIKADGKPSAFADDIVSLSTFGEKNKETLGELLFHFFRRYAHELDYEKYVISIREGGLISKEAKKWHLMQNNRLCVEEPFNTERNLGNTADDISFRGVHLELRRAFDLVCDCKLEDCMEEYVFPPVEEKIWEKPAPKPAPTLTPSQPHSIRGGRGGFANRGARHGSSQHRAGQQGRRASSATASNRFTNSQAIGQLLAASKHPLQAHYEQQQLHDQLINEYQYLQAQEHELRLAQAQAQLLQLQGSNQITSSGQQVGRDQLNRPSMNLQPPMTAPLQHAHPIYPYPIQAYHPGPVHTNPSSPSIKPVQPELRRSINRSNPPNEASSASLRSHSQPARPYQMALPLQNPQALLLNGYSVQQLRQQHMYQHLESQDRLRHPQAQAQLPFLFDSRYEDNVPKEYVGYYVHDSPPAHTAHRHPGEGAPRRIHPYHDIPHASIVAPNGFGRLRGPSRSPSPSPSIPSRDRSTSIRSAASAPSGPLLTDRAENSSHPRTSGPIIVDGSDAWYPTIEQQGGESSMERASRANGVPYHASPIDYKATPGETPPHRSGTIASDAFQKHTPWPLPPREAQRFLENGRMSNAESLRRPYPQVNGTAPAPAAMRYTGTVANGHGLEISKQATSTESPVSKSHKVATKEDRNQLIPIPKDEPPSDTLEASQNQSPKALPLLLSPVREVRTPSPTANRKEGGAAAAAAAAARPANRLAQRYQLQEIPPFSKSASGKQEYPDPPTTQSNGNIAGAPNGVQAVQPMSNGWQQTTSKKSKKHKAKGSTSLTTSTSLSETIPDNAAERKGG